jgi:hypothetical protein
MLCVDEKSVVSRMMVYHLVKGEVMLAVMFEGGEQNLEALEGLLPFLSPFDDEEELEPEEEVK